MRKLFQTRILRISVAGGGTALYSTSIELGLLLNVLLPMDVLFCFVFSLSVCHLRDYDPVFL